MIAQVCYVMSVEVLSSEKHSLTIHQKLAILFVSYFLFLFECTCCSPHRSLDAEAPIYLAEQFTRVSDMTSGTLRSSNLTLMPPRLKSRNGQNFFAYRGSSIWNSLPSEIKSSRTFGRFQIKLKAILAETDYKKKPFRCFD